MHCQAKVKYIYISHEKWFNLKEIFLMQLQVAYLMVWTLNLREKKCLGESDT